MVKTLIYFLVSTWAVLQLTATTIYAFVTRCTRLQCINGMKLIFYVRTQNKWFIFWQCQTFFSFSYVFHLKGIREIETPCNAISWIAATALCITIARLTKKWVRVSAVVVVQRTSIAHLHNSRVLANKICITYLIL